MTYRSHGAFGPPAVQLIDAYPVGTTYEVVETVEAPSRRGRNGLAQFGLEFGQAAFGAVLGLVKAVVGLGMPLGVLASVGFLILYGFIGVPACLTWAAASAGLAFASFTFCYLSGLFEARVERFVAKGR